MNSKKKKCGSRKREGTIYFCKFKKLSSKKNAEMGAMKSVTGPKYQTSASGSAAQKRVLKKYKQKKY
jgi:hypothetical protein